MVMTLLLFAFHIARTLPRHQYSGRPPMLTFHQRKSKEQHGSRTDIEPRTPAVFEGQWEIMEFGPFFGPPNLARARSPTFETKSS